MKWTRYGEVVGEAGGRVSLRVRREQVPAVTARLLAELPVADLAVEDPPLESLMDRDLQGGGRLMRRILALVGAYTRRDLLMFLSWRGFVFTLVLGQAVPPLISMAVWNAAMPHLSHLPAYFLALLLVRHLTVSYEEHTFSSRIYAGEVADDLLRPCPVPVVPLGSNLAMKATFFVVGGPLLLMGLWLMGQAFPFRGADLALALPALVLAAAVRFLWTYTLALSAFWTERAFGVVHLGNLLVFFLGGEAAPPDLLPAWLQPIVIALPFRYMLSFPAEVALGRLSAPDLALSFGLQLCWAVALGALAAVVWRSGVKRFSAVGG